MRYLKHAETGAVRQVPDDDDAQFAALQAERLSNGREAWVQTGSQDPDVAAAIGAPADGVAASLSAAAATDDNDKILGEAPAAGTVTAIAYVPEAAITGANTDTRTLTVVNKGQDGTGNTTVGTLAFTAGINAAAFDEKAFTLSGTAGNKKVAKGDVLVAVSTHAGSSGLADPGGQVRVSIDPAQP